jgi:hypothetical protein
MESTLSARATAQGLALLGDKRAAPFLLRLWGEDPWVNLEVARALGWCDALESADALSQLSQQEKQPILAAFAARCLGDMLDPDHPWRLSRLTEGNCTANPVEIQSPWIVLSHRSPRVVREFHGLSNPFLYWIVLPRGLGRGIDWE